MTFPKEVVEELLVACHRCCCLCHKFCGSKIEIHHIIPKSEGGQDTIENAIALCFDCHAEVGAYNAKHPKGRKFSPEELSKHKEQWLKLCSSIRAFQKRGEIPEVTLTGKDFQDFEAVFQRLRVEDPISTQNLVRSLFLRGGGLPDRFFAFTLTKMKSEDEDERWKAAWVVEEYSHWNYQRVNVELLIKMAYDAFFGVRSVAAVVFFDLSQANPSIIPLDTVYRLALDGDWYVHRPALATLKFLTVTRPVALDLIIELFQRGDEDLKERALRALEDVGKVNPEVLSEEKLDPLLREGSQRGRVVHQKLKETLNNLPDEKKQRYYPF